MLKNYFKLALRNLWKRKSYAFINILGFSLGLASVMTLALVVYQYYTTDDIQENKNEMYYLRTHTKENSHTLTPFPLLYEIQKSAPEVDASTHIQSWSWPWLTYGNKSAQENTMYVDTGFFNVFSFKLLEGSPATALKQKFHIVISEDIKKQLFGNEPALGKAVMANDSIPLTVAGVLEKIPSNSSVQAEVLLTTALLNDDKGFRNNANWYNTFAQNYLLLRKGADPGLLDKKIKTIVDENYPEEHKSQVIETTSFSLIRQEGSSNVRVIVTGAIASSVIILLIVIVNLLNLNAATMFDRAKEVAVRQVIGSGKRAIVIQFCIENTIVVFMSLITGFLIFYHFLLPQLNRLIGPDVGELLFQWDHDYFVILVFAVIAIIVIVLAGSYPAVYLTSVKVTDAIKGKISRTSGKGSVRNVFIVLQFTLAIILICAAIILKQQISYMKTESPGFDMDHVAVVNLGLDFKDPQSAAAKLDVILQSLRDNPYVKAFSTTQEIPTNYWENYNEYIDVKTNKKISLRQPGIDAGFAATFGIPVIAGRNFNEDLAASEGGNIILNETAVQAFGWKDPIGKQLKESGSVDIYTVIGVMKDYHYSNLQQKIQSLIHGFKGKQGLGYNRYLSINMDIRHSEKVLSALEREFKNIPSKRPFTYHYMGDLVGKQYDLLSGILKITNYVAFLTIGIACMGMLGLIAVSARRRIKEIGIRKVLGASISEITVLIAKDFVRIVLFAVVIAIPLSWLVMNRWLQDFAYRIQIEWWMLALAGIAAVLITLLTVSFHAIKAAVANPVKSLRTE